MNSLSALQPTTMAPATNLNRLFSTPPAIQKKVRCLVDTPEEIPQHSIKATRRLALGLASIALFANPNISVSLAEDNGFWITGPIPVPQVSNKINNEETGTRSFIKKGVYVAEIGTKGRQYRLKRSAFDLLALGDLIGKDAWDYVRRYLRVKSTLMYYDFDKFISAAPAADQQPLTDLANRLFNTVEKLEDAVKKENLPETESLYQDTTTILQEVMTRMS